METTRAHVIVTGTVQGVNFRATCRDQARLAKIGGWVKNLPDGSVEAIFEGSQAGVQRMISWCYSGPIHAKVQHVEVTWQEPTHREPTFDIAW
ncbi:MAG TPA: acylphosphatase [Herpetosiphon sp.]|uniref:Acylphosphatase n=1 Tax=Herpetosiphon aurantiacus (strain ATCC 23779 / DSM 785 / 114-95) TaxID=316274 RepID=A9B3U3_HERA2|nr:acylphosphatase [Herpetosiphon sp.]ABX06079.1 acylphosphatase [Herpetosiphon aurantiacus DSM 785]MCA0351813.1 acylphosphatase [Chloroflexota bacterium]HBW48699.1 acylphosphatase [Herpetosiphon sp.]